MAYEIFNSPSEAIPTETDLEVPTFSSSPEEIKNYVRRLHESDTGIDTKELDVLLLGTAATDADSKLWGGNFSREQYDEMDSRYPGEKPWLGSHEIIWTPYSMSRDIVNSTNLSETDTLYDLGAGYGRLVLYAGITAVAACKGIEMVSERVELARAAIDKLEIENAELIEGKVQDQDYRDGDVFYMYSPFTQKTFLNVFDQLEEIAASKPITVINRGGNVDWAKHQGRLKGLELVKATDSVSYYETRDIAHTPDSRIKNPDA